MQALLTGFALGVVYCAAAYRIYLWGQPRRKRARYRGRHTNAPREQIGYTNVNRRR